MTENALNSAPTQSYIGVGSNLANPSQQVDAAIGRLAGLTQCSLIARSSLYRSAPFGGIEQPEFVNAVVALETRLPARKLFEHLQGIERAQGRDRGERRWGPRIIDLDLLVYGRAVIAEPDLTVPHPGIAERNFVLLPLAEIAPDLVIPGLGPVSSIEVNASEPRIERIG